MKALLIGIFATLVLAACGSAESSSHGGPFSFIEPEFTEIVADFDKEVADRGAEALYVNEVRFAKPYETSTYLFDLDNQVLGRCYYTDRKHVVIVINPTSWKLMDGTTQRLLLYHELGHCALRLHHRAERVPTSDGKSLPEIMTPYMAMQDDTGRIAAYWAELVDHMFEYAAQGGREHL